MSKEWWPGAALDALLASWLQITMAKVCGKKVVGEDSGCTVTGYWWRGKLYMTDCKRNEPQSPRPTEER